MDHRIALTFKSLSWFWGSCFQKDILNLVYLCKFYGLEEVAEYWHQVVKINDYQKQRFAQKIIDHFGGDLIGKTITILGWAFKANTNDSRESAAIYVTEYLYKSGAEIVVYDPQVSASIIYNDIQNYWSQPPSKNMMKKRCTVVSQPPLQGDAIAILTEWEEFKHFKYENKKVFDGRNLLKVKRKNYIKL